MLTLLAVPLAAAPTASADGPRKDGARKDSARKDGARAGDRPEAHGPVISPVPRSQTERRDEVTITRTVHLVSGPKADPAALKTVRTALRAAGAQRVLDTGKPGGGKNLTVYVGGPQETPASAGALAALKLKDTAGLPAEGHVVGIGRGADRADRIVVAGAGPAGTFYAAQSLRQVLPQRGRPGGGVDGLSVRDWPGTGLRGVIEGFYGIPWTQAQRLDQLDFYGEHKMNIYVYSPKDDTYLREKWREPYPAQQLAEIKALTDRARANHVEFTYALSPGLSVCYSSDADAKALIDKFQSIWDIGVRTSAVPLDDISYTNWNCAADKERFGTGGAAAGAAQAYLLNRVNREFIKTHPGAEPLQMVPTEYYDTTASPYKKAIAEQLDADVLVEWTGVGVVAPRMTAAQARDARKVFGHPILTWDNYPVNDYVTNRLLLGPFAGRERGLPGELAGITANPMNQPAASKIALATVADFAWNDAAYDGDASYRRAIAEMAGGDRRTERALREFSDLSYSSLLNEGNAPELSPRLKEFWDGTLSARRLDAVLERYQKAPAVLRERLDDRGFVVEAGPWLDAAREWSRTARTALKMAVAVRDGDDAEAWRLRQRLPAMTAKAASFVYVDLNGRKIPVKVGEGVLDAFVTDAVAAHDKALGVAGRAVAFTDIPGVYNSNSVDRMVDGDRGTYYWSDGSPKPGSTFGVDLGSEQEITGVSLEMAKPDSKDDYLRKGVLEYSTDRVNWKELAAFADKPEVAAEVPSGTRARYVRARSTGSQSNWLVVREFAVKVPERVSGGPEAAAGSKLADAADGYPDSVYTAGRPARAGEAVAVALREARSAKSVVVLRPEEAAAAKASVQVRDAANGSWRTVGRLSGAYTACAVSGDGKVDAVRLVWEEGDGLPAVNEVIVK